MSLIDEKKKLRRDVLARMKALGSDERRVRSERLVARFLADPTVQRASTISGFVSFGDEVQTDALLRALLNSGKRLGLPRAASKADPLTFHSVTSLDADVVLGPLGFHEPLTTLPILAPDAFDLIIVPGLAFDELGNRLGRGAGHYDRFLEHANPAAIRYALAFECQIVPAIPTQPHDLPVHAVFTEDRLIRA